MTTNPEAEIQRSLELLIAEGAVHELRVLKTSRGTQSGFFDDLQQMSMAALKLNTQSSVFFTINPVNTNLLARSNNRVRAYVKQGECASDSDIVRRRFFPIDFDPVRPAGISSTDEEHEAAIQRARQCRQWLSDHGWPVPVLCDSGNGAHLLPRVNLPNDETSTKLLEQGLKALAAEFNDDQVIVDPTTYNPSRIWKLYGTLARKGDAMPERPHRIARILEAPDRLDVVPLELLEQLAEMAPRPKKRSPRARAADRRPSAPSGRGDFTTLDVVKWFKAHGNYGRDLGNGKHSVHCPWVSEHTDQRPAEDSDTVIWEAVPDHWPSFHCSHAHCDGRNLNAVMELWRDADSYCSSEFRPGRNGRRSDSDHDGADSPELPVIPITGLHMREITDDALAALKANDEIEPILFARGNTAVRILPGAEGVSAEALTQASLRGVLDRAADFVKFTDDGDTPARPPMDVVTDILSLPDLPFQVLRGFSETPVFLPGGAILHKSGYDHKSGLYLQLNGLDGIRADVPLDEARELLLGDLLGNFPFANKGSKAHAIAFVLLPFVRPLIDGPTPLHLVDAPARGTGKGLLVDVAAGISLGRPAAVMTVPRDDDELEKRITAMLVEGRSMTLMDNVLSLKSTTLSAVLTTTLWRGRWLGQSKMVEAPNTTTWVATGNNVVLSDEMLRRTVHIRLDAGREDPENRTGFRHPNLMTWVRSNRAALVSSCLSLVQTWIDAGMPAGEGTLGRFERWVEVIGGILKVAGIEGFLGNREDLYAEADVETREWSLLCAAWWEQHGELAITAKDLLEIAKAHGLVMDVWAGRRGLAGQQRFGHALRARRDRVFDAFCIRHAGNDGNTKSQSYRLEHRGLDKTTETPETSRTTPSDSVDETGGFELKPPKNPVDKKQNPLGSPGTKRGVSGVSGVLSGPPLADANSESQQGELPLGESNDQKGRLKFS